MPHPLAVILPAASGFGREPARIAVPAHLPMREAALARQARDAMMAGKRPLGIGA